MQAILLSRRADSNRGPLHYERLPIASASLGLAVYVDEAVEIPAVRRYLEQFLELEAIPTLTEIPGHPASTYAATTLERFGNTRIRDQIARLCVDGTAKFPNFLIPTIEAQLERDGPFSRAALALAAWSRYLATVPAGERAPDSLGKRSSELASRSIDDPLAFLELDEVFTPALRASTRFRDEFSAAGRALAERGPIGAIEQTLQRQSGISTGSVALLRDLCW